MALSQPLGIFAQGLLGGITVLTHLNPLAVAGHFVLSIFLISAATSLHSRRRRPFIRTSSPDAVISRISLLHLLLSFAVIIAGTLVTGSGPHAGDLNAPRLRIPIQSIALIHGSLVICLIVVAALFYTRSTLRPETKRWVNVFFLFAFVQGMIGYIQYLQGVPELLVATHLLGSTLVWIATWRIRLSVVRKPA